MYHWNDLLRRRRILRRVQRTKKPEVLFNRVVKRICEFVLEPLFEASCKRRAVSEVQNRVPATSRSGQIFSVCQCVCGHFFLQALFESTRDDFKGVYREKTSLKVGSSKSGGHRTAPISREARNWLMLVQKFCYPRDWTLFRS